MTLLQRRHAWLRHLALLCTVVVLAVTSLSAFIRLSNAGLGCSDWPQCYGNRLHATPRADAAAAEVSVDSDGVRAARIAHRVVAVLALFLVIAMAVVCFGNTPWLQREGLLALTLLVLALALAVLGRASAGARMPVVAMGNVLGGFLMLALSWRLADTQHAHDAQPAGSSATWARVGAVLLIAQVALGALVSSSYAGLSCAGTAECWRAADSAGWPWHVLNPLRDPQFDAGRVLPLNPGSALAQLVHRGGALLLLLVLAPLGVAALRRGRQRDGFAVLALLLVQLGLGALMLASGLPLAASLAHNMVAACLLASVARLA